MKPEEWIVGRDVGTSSKTIWAVMVGVDVKDTESWNWGVPLDADDFGRCYRLLVLFPQWRERLPEVAAIFPAWGPLVEHWEKLSLLYEHWRDKVAPKVDWQNFCYFIDKLNNEGKLLDGWIQDSPGSWHKDRPQGRSSSVTLTAESAKKMTANIDAILKKGK